MDSAGRLQLIKELCSFEGRGPGTDAERRAANFLGERIEQQGRRVEIEPTLVHPQFALVHAVHAALAIAASILGRVQPAAGFALVLFVATSTYLDLNSRLYLVRRLFFRRGSQNVVSPGPRPEAPVRLILVAHYDAARTGFLFGVPYRLARRFSARTRLMLGPFRIFFWGGIAPLLPILGARMAGFHPAWLSVVQLIPTATLIVAAFLFVDIALSETVPGANDNASGVAAVLSAAEQLDADPPANLDVWVLLTGAEECLCEGMRAFIRDHRAHLDADRTAIVNVDSVGHGEVGYRVSEGAVASVPLDSELIGLCAALATADREGENRFGAVPQRYPLLDDAMPASARGLPAVTIHTSDGGFGAPWHHRTDDLPERIDSATLARSTEFVVSLARLLDRDAGRRPAAG